MAKKATTNLFGEPEVKTPAVTDDVIDIDIAAIKRTRFRINGDNSKIIELNLSDMNIGNRLEQAYNTLNTLMDEVVKTIPEDVEDETSRQAALEALDKLNVLMEEQVDYIFDYPVSKIFEDGGTMWDPEGGMFRYEHIIDRLAKLYENKLSAEFTAMRNRLNSTMETKRKAVSKYHK